MLESNQDDLSGLGSAPPAEDVRAMIARALGDRPVTLEHADELLAALGDGQTAAAAAGPSVGAAASAEASKPGPAVFVGAPPRPEVAPSFDSRPAPAAVAAPVFDARTVSVEAPSVFDDAIASERTDELGRGADERGAEAADQLGASRVEAPAPGGARASDARAEVSSRYAEDEAPDHEPADASEGEAAGARLERTAAVDPEVTAQAIEAAFGFPERTEESVLGRETQPDGPRDGSALPLAAADRGALEWAADSSGARRERGARRPDLDMLLDQPLEAFDFERDGPEGGAEPAGSAVASSASELQGGAASGEADGDDFEILVDDEILEIAEDDVELVDDGK